MKMHLVQTLLHFQPIELIQLALLCVWEWWSPICVEPNFEQGKEVS